MVLMFVQWIAVIQPEFPCSCSHKEDVGFDNTARETVSAIAITLLASKVDKAEENLQALAARRADYVLRRISFLSKAHIDSVSSLEAASWKQDPEAGEK
jgi:hypothetical protein